jgi:hypothetical protein
MDCAYEPDEKNMKRTQNFGEKTSWYMATSEAVETGGQHKNRSQGNRM